MTENKIAENPRSARRITAGGMYRERPRVRKNFSKPSLAKQSFKEECDINNILGKFRKTGLLTHTKENNGMYSELPELEDYHHAMTQIAEAQQSFETLPSDLRAKFGNDPGAFLDFVHDEKNIDAMVEMGLMQPPSEPTVPPSVETPVPAPAAPDPAPSISPVPSPDGTPQLPS
ncbi:internal scaffolding protein [Microviridae sp.]|nr:internal scaffolding protein [Microviridae sp.]